MDIQNIGVVVDIETRRQKQQALILKLVERKVRSRARQLYETRGEVEGHALQDWVQAEAEVVGNGIIAPLYHRRRNENQPTEEIETAKLLAADASACETSA